MGRGTALFVCGWCFSPQAPVRGLEFLLNGTPQPVMAHGMPRLDPFRMLHPDIDPYASEGLDRDPGSPEDPLLLSYRSGFWGIVRIDGPRPEGELTLSLRARLEGGQEAEADLGRLVCATLPEPATVAWPEGASGAPVAVSMATFNPPQALLKAQIDSIMAQTHGNWVCVISDDCSSPERFAAIRATVGDDPRFVVSRSPRRLGFYRNFERALALVPRGRPVRRARRSGRLAGTRTSWRRWWRRSADAQLVYSDARVVSRDGALISETWWNRTPQQPLDLLSLLVANAVTGAASLLRRELLDDTLPFPPAQFAHFHDHWIGARRALALGEIEFVDRPLYDYVQHGDASLGHAAANQMPSLRDRLRAPARAVASAFGCGVCTTSSTSAG